MLMNTQTVPKRWLVGVLVIVALAFALLSSACEPGELPGGLAQLPETTEGPPAEPVAETGPQAWIEYPLEGETLPSGEPVVFVVYATDAQGVTGIELRANGQPLPAAPVEGISPDGSSRLVRLEQEWTPDGGEYMVEARGRNAAGSYGEPSYVKFCYGSCEKETPTPAPAEEPTPTPAPAPTEEPKPAPATQYDLYVRRMDFNTDTPAVGEKVQLFIMIATDTYPGQGAYFPASYFRWRQGPTFPWNEEACPANAQYASCTKTVEFSYSQPGSYQVEVEADSRQEIAEKDETNNAGSWTVTVSAAAQYDLYVRRMDFNTDTPAVGEKVQLFIMIASDTYPSQGPYFPASHFRWRQGPTFPWNEEACPADTHYASCTKTVEFSYSQPGSYQVEVEADSRQEIAEKDETNNAGSWTVTVSAAKPPTPTNTPPPDVVIEYWVDQQYINAGECTTLRWNVQGVQAVYLDDQGVVGTGEKKVCPCQDTTYTLRVVYKDSSETTHGITIYVTGQCAAPPTEQPPPPQDTAGPGVSGMGLTWEDCKFYGHATVSDPSGVGWAQFHFNIDGGEDHGLWMSDLGGGYYQTEYGFDVTSGGIGTPAGNIEYYVIASDSLGNQSESSPGSCYFMGCGGCQ
jgi:hypothetical protein